jgi:Na+/H+-dicarboxylate symporter
MMLQVIFFALFLGIAMITLPEKKVQPFKDFFDSFNDIILRMIDIIMKGAPFGVFALMAALVAESPSMDIFKALGAYALTVIAGLLILIFVFYPTLIYLFTKRDPRKFLRQISPAQLLAFSTSSSAATLPVTMDVVEKKVGVDNEVTSFVLPIGATVNMDGTSLYQAVAAVFIAQAFGMDLSLMAPAFPSGKVLHRSLETTRQLTNYPSGASLSGKIPAWAGGNKRPSAP